MTFEEAFKAYLVVSGTQRSAAYQDTLMCRFFVSQFGRNCPLADITPKMISRALSVLRDKRIKRKEQMVPLSPATINRHTQFLQRVFGHAQEALGEQTHSIKWKAFITIEPEVTIYPLTEQEEQWVADNIDPAVRSVFQFSLLTGVRLKNAVTLRWDMINWEKQELTFRAKSRRPGGKIYIVPLTSKVIQLLKEQEGNHDEFVFTYIAKRNDRHSHHRGRRYPLTTHVVRYYWEALGLGKRWHDVRHTFGTRLYGISKDIHLVQRAMNHTDIHTTMKYVHTNREDIRAAMEKLPFRKVNNPSAESHTPATDGQNKNVLKFERKQRGAADWTRTSTDLSASTSKLWVADDDENK
jgi:integrase